ncbi:MAG TPA: hypothetical protein VFX39_06130 [Gemmatimonadaceae bacterium]|nr:hypothetical protein [Gemmatimonadaceae bacterium]
MSLVSLTLAVAALPAAAAAQNTPVWSTPTRTEQVDPARMERAPVVSKPGPIDRRLVGAWDVWISGAVTYRTDGRAVYQRYEPGAAMNRLQISADGRYQWGDRKGRLVEVQPWHAQEGRRYWRIANAQGTEYEFYYADGDKLVVLFGGVGGHAATGTRLSGSPGATSASGGASAASSFAAGDRVEIEWSGRWFGGRIVRADKGRYLVSYDGYDRSWDEWVAPARLRRPAAAPAPAPGAARPASPASPATPATPAPTSGPARPAAPSAPAGNPLGVEWVGGGSSSATSRPSQPTAGSNPLGVEWVGTNARPAPVTPPAPPEPAPPPPPPTTTRGSTDAALAAALTDRWLYRAVAFVGNGTTTSETRGVSGSLVLEADGSYAQSLVIGGIGNNVKGSWRVEEGRLVTTYVWRGTQTTDRFELQLGADGKRLTLVLRGTTVAYYTLDQAE